MPEPTEDSSPIDDHTLAQLVSIELSLAQGSWPQIRDSTIASTADVSELTDCLQMIERVRRYSPQALADLSVADENLESNHIHAEQSASPETQEDSLQFGRFKIREEIGEGGFGLVYRAFDPDLQREVALKLPRLTTLASSASRERFLREARAMAALNHPQIATIHEAGSQGAVCYMACAYYQGGNLAERISDIGPLPCNVAAQFVVALADGVQFAHSRGILHRDLKPSNVLIDTAASRDEPTAKDLRISDFGLASFIEEEVEATRSGALVGTPAYMSPEQAESRLSDISTQSDVYALGAILYELLSGQPPFRRATTLATLEAVRHAQPVSLRRNVPELPPDLEAICLKCLEKTPARRYATANALSQDLQNWLQGRPVSARRPTAVERFSRFCRNNPAFATACGLLVASILVGTLTSTAFLFRAQRNAQLANQNAQQLAAAVDNLHSAIDTLFVTVADSPELKRADAEPLRKKLLDQASDYYQLVVQQRPETTTATHDYAATLQLLAMVRSQLGDQSGAAQTLREALDALQELPDNRENQLTSIEWNRRLAQILDKRGKHEQARKLQLQAIVDAESQEDSAGASFKQRLTKAQALLWADVAGGELIESDLDAADTAARTAIELWQNELLSDDAHHHLRDAVPYANCLWIVGIAEEESNHLLDAEAHHQQALDILLPMAAKSSDPDIVLLTGRVHKNLGIAVAKQNRLEEARAQYLLALDFLGQLQQEHPNVPEYAMEFCSTQYSLSVTEYLAGNLQRTLELLDQNVAKYLDLAESFPDQEFDYLNRAGVDWNMISAVEFKRGNETEAIAAIEKALDVYRRVERARPGWIWAQILMAESESNLANLLIEQERWDEAEQYLTAAKNRVQPIVEQQSEHERAVGALFGVHNALAEQYLRRGMFEQAMLANEEAIDLMPRATNAWDAHVRQVRLRSIDGDHDGALTLLLDLESSAVLYRHSLEIARAAGWMLDRSSAENNPHASELEALGLRAYQRAAEAFEGSAAEFQSLVGSGTALRRFQPFE
jgi:serine/threonine protein kinase